MTHTLVLSGCFFVLAFCTTFPNWMSGDTHDLIGTIFLPNRLLIKSPFTITPVTALHVYFSALANRMHPTIAPVYFTTIRHRRSTLIPPV